MTRSSRAWLPPARLVLAREACTPRRHTTRRQRRRQAVLLVTHRLCRLWHCAARRLRRAKAGEAPGVPPWWRLMTRSPTSTRVLQQRAASTTRLPAQPRRLLMIRNAVNACNRILTTTNMRAGVFETRQNDKRDASEYARACRYTLLRHKSALLHLVSARRRGTDARGSSYSCSVRSKGHCCLAQLSRKRAVCSARAAGWRWACQGPRCTAWLAPCRCSAVGAAPRRLRYGECLWLACTCGSPPPWSWACASQATTRTFLRRRLRLLRRVRLGATACMHAHCSPLGSQLQALPAARTRAHAAQACGMRRLMPRSSLAPRYRRCGLLRAQPCSSVGSAHARWACP